MSLPVGVVTKTLTIGRPFDALGNYATLAISVTPVFGGTAQRLVWSATGETLEAVTVKPPAQTDPDGDATESIDLPIVDQAGWLDGSGNAITNWSYQVSVTPTFTVNSVKTKMKTYTKFVSPLSTMTSPIDMDKLPDGTAAAPILAPGVGVTSVAGELGPVITAADLVPALGVGTLTAPLHNDGSTDATAYLNGLFTTAVTLGLTLVLQGTYRIDGAAGRGLQVQSGLRIDARNARVVKNYTDSGGTFASLVTGASTTVKTNKVTIIGGSWGVNDLSMTGNIFGFYGDDWTLRDVHVEGYSGGRAYAVFGDRPLFTNCTATGSTLLAGDGGLRVLGGSDGKAIGCHIESGDDGLQIVPSGGTTVLSNGDTKRWQFIGCTGFSTRGRFICIGLQNRAGMTTGIGQTPSMEMTSVVTDCKFIGCVGSGGSANSWHITNDNSVGQGGIAIDGIDIIGCQVDPAGSQAAAAEADVTRGSRQWRTVSGDVGRVRNIRVQDFRSRAPRRTALRAQGGVEDVTIENFNIADPEFASVAGGVFTSGSNTVTFPAPADGNPPPFDQDSVGAALSVLGVTPAVIPTLTVVGTVSDDGLTITMVDAGGAAKNALRSTTADMTVGSAVTLDITGSVRFKAINCTFGNSNGGDTVRAGAISDTTLRTGQVISGTTVDASFVGCRFTDIGNGFYGLDFTKATGAKVRDCTFVGLAGESSAGGVRVGAASTGVQILSGNNFSAISTAAKRINNLATDTTVATQNPGITSASVDVGGWLTPAVLASDVLVGNDTYVTILTVSGLVVGQQYTVDAFLPYAVASTTSRASIKWSAPGGSVFSWDSGGISGTSNTSTGPRDWVAKVVAGSSTLGGGAGADLTARPRGVLTAGASGSLSLTFAQAVNTPGESAIARAGASLRAQRIA